jgi:acyl-CoA thioesterase II
VHLLELFDLTPHGVDTFMGAGPVYPWGGLYGGHIVAQALRAAAFTVDSEQLPHSLRAYFIRRGDTTQPVRYDVDRTRNGKSFTTRRVVASQENGAILTLEASFQRVEQSADVVLMSAPTNMPDPESVKTSRWLDWIDRRWIEDPQRTTASAGPRDGAGRAIAWMKTSEQLGDHDLIHRCALAYLSDDLPTDAAIRAHPTFGERVDLETDWDLFTASLDHNIWFHRPMRADAWHLYDFTCHTFVGGRGLTIGHVFTAEGLHVATIAQETLVRDTRNK